MATNYYVLEGSASGNTLRVVIHIEVPAPPASNEAGIEWQTVVAGYVAAS